MKRTFASAVILASAFSLGAAGQSLSLPSAPTPAGAPPVESVGPAKVAVIAFKVAVAQTNEGQRDFADLEKKYMPREQQLKALSDEVDSLTKQLQAQADKLSDAERASKAKAIDDKKKKLDRDAEDAKTDFQQEMGELYNTLASKVYDVLAAYVDLHGYTLVLDVSEQQNPVLYADPLIEITKPVIDAYNEKSGVPAPPAQASPAAAKPAAPKPSAPKPAAPKAPAAH